MKDQNKVQKVKDQNVLISDSHPFRHSQFSSKTWRLQKNSDSWWLSTTDGMTYSMTYSMIYSLTFGQYEQLKPPSPKSCCPWHRSTSSMRTRPEEIAETWNRMRNRMKLEWNPATVVSLCFCGVLLLLSLLASSSFSVYSVLVFSFILTFLTSIFSFILTSIFYLH